jgi:hypothetical protein
METYGYDYAFALKLDQVNALIARRLSRTVMSIAYSGTDPQTGLAFDLTGTLLPWTVVPGGSGNLLNLRLAFGSGTMSVTPFGSADLASVHVVVQVSLGWLGSGTPAQRGSGGNTHLAFTAQQSTDPANPGYVKVSSIAGLPPSSTDLQGVLQNNILAVLVANQQNLRFVLASANPTPANVSSWLSPVKWDYCYTDIDGGSDGILCFLCMLTDGVAPPPAPAFDTSAVANGGNAFLLVSQQMFFQHVVLPAIQSSLSGTFEVVSTAGGGFAVMNSGEFRIDKVTVHSMMISPLVNDTGLGASLTGGGPLKDLFGVSLPDATYKWSSSSSNALAFNPAAQTVTFAADPHPTRSSSHHLKWYDWAILGGVGITGVPALTDALAALVTNAATDADRGLSDAAGNAVQRALGGSITNLANLVDWNQDGCAFTAGSACLQNAFVVTGTLA